MATTIQNPPNKNPNHGPEDDDFSGRQMSFLEHLEELRLGLGGGRLPGQAFRKAPAGRAETRHQLRLARQAHEPRGQRRRVAVRHQETRLPIPHRLPPAGAIGRPGRIASRQK